jgi:hypothetical protein
MGRCGASAEIMGMDQLHACQRFQSEAQRLIMAALIAELDGINPMEANFGNLPQEAHLPEPLADGYFRRHNPPLRHVVLRTRSELELSHRHRRSQGRCCRRFIGHESRII